MDASSLMAIGIVMGAAIVGIIWGIKKLVSWCSEISYQVKCNKFDNGENKAKCNNLSETCRYLSEHGTEVLKTFASVHERLLDLEAWMNKDDELVKEETTDDS